MLEGLDQVDWAQLDHAYGPAVDVPDMLRSLASQDEDEAERALRKLYSTIWHQGTVYPATAHAVPFLIELSARPEVLSRNFVLELLLDAASGGGYVEAHGHYDVFRKERQTAGFKEALAKELRTVRAAFDAVVQGTPTYLRLLQDPDPHVRKAAANLLPLCVDQFPEVMARLQEQIDAERLAVIKAEMLKLMVWAWLAPGFRPERTRPLSAAEAGYLIALMRSADEPLAVRLSAAAQLLAHGRADLADEALPLFDQGLEGRGSSVDALQAYGPSTVMHMVEAALHDRPGLALAWMTGRLASPDEDIQTTALFVIENLCSIWRWAPAIAAPHMALLLESDSEKVSLHSAAAFNKLGRAGEIASKKLHQLARKAKNPVTRNWAAKAYGLVTGENRPYTVEAWLGRHRALRKRIPDVIDTFRTLVEDGGAAYDVILPVIRTLEVHPAGAKQATPWLEKALDLSDSWGRVYAARALWAIDGPGHVDAILKLFRDEELKPRPACLLVIDCLRQMGPYARPLIPELDEIAHSERRFDDDVWLDEALQDLAEQALASIQRSP